MNHTIIVEERERPANYTCELRASARRVCYRGISSHKHTHSACALIKSNAGPVGEASSPLSFYHLSAEPHVFPGLLESIGRFWLRKNALCANSKCFIYIAAREQKEFWRRSAT